MWLNILVIGTTGGVGWNRFLKKKKKSRYSCIVNKSVRSMFRTDSCNEHTNMFSCVTFNLWFSGTSRLLGAECEASEVKRRRKQRTLTLCAVCNIQLNSSAQAQIHYNGKTHQRRLRQASRAKTSGGARNSTGNGDAWNPGSVFGVFFSLLYILDL